MKLLITLVLMAVSFSLQASDSLYTAQIFHFKGDVTLSTLGGEFGEVERGEHITEGDLLKTGERSFVIIRFPDKSTMRVEPDSEIVFEKLVERIEGTSLGSSDLVLKAGRAIINIINKDKAPIFNMRTKEVAMGIRGTRFMAGIDNITGHTEVAVDRGEVEVSHINNPEIGDAVDAGHGIHIENGKKFTQPHPYDWVKQVDFNTEAKEVNHDRNKLLHERKRSEFSKKRKEWKRDPAKWKARKEKWAKLRKEYLKKAEAFKEKRKQFREKKKQFQERRKILMQKRNALIKASNGMREQYKQVRQERMSLQKEAQALKTGRKDPRKKMELMRRREELKKKSELLKEKRKALLKQRKDLKSEKQQLMKDFKVERNKVKEFKKEVRSERQKMRRRQNRKKSN